MNFSGYLCFDQYHERNGTMLEILVKYLFAAIPTLNNKLGTNKVCIYIKSFYYFVDLRLTPPVRISHLLPNSEMNNNE